MESILDPKTHDFSNNHSNGKTIYCYLCGLPEDRHIPLESFKFNPERVHGKERFKAIYLPKWVVEKLKGTYLAAALILMIGYLAIRLADARMNLEPEIRMEGR